MLTSELVRQVKQLQIRTGRQVADVLAGEYASVFKGRGMEFDEVRPYVPGDDVRTIDWNVTARMGAPYVKRFVEERELTVLLVVDISSSQDFGSAHRSKREAASELSALIAFTASYNDDKIGLLLFNESYEAEVYIPPRKGQRHAMRIVREVLSPGVDESEQTRWRLPDLIRRRWKRLKALTRRESEPKTRTANIRHAMDFCQKVFRRRAVVFLVSDFIDEGYVDTLQAANRKHDLVAALVSDPQEREIANAGMITLEDAETGRKMVVDTSSRAFRKMMQQQNRSRVETTRSALAASGIDLIEIDAAGDAAEPLIAFFRGRQRRLRR